LSEDNRHSHAGYDGNLHDLVLFDRALKNLKSQLIKKIQKRSHEARLHTPCLIILNIPRSRCLIMKISHLSAFTLLVVFFFTSPVCALINTIPVGGTVFIGEQGLDVSGGVAPAPIDIGWWASGAAIATSSPDYQMSIPDSSNFFVSPTEFSSRTGTWYRLPAKTVIFNVADPQLAIRVEDTSVSVDVTDKWVPTDDQIRFRIEHNLGSIAQRAGQTSTPITIKVQAPDGGIYSSLVNKAGTATSIVNIPVTTTPFYTDSIWDTGQRSIYMPGTYSIWAECNVNSMKDNYNFAGKSVSQKSTLLNQDQNPLIGGKHQTSTTVPVTTKVVTTIQSPTPTITSVPTTAKPVIVETTQIPTIPSTPVSIVTGTQALPATTKSPGFTGILTGLAALISLIVYIRKN
jgi:hypothetical protein